jgi:hypothetical protein
LINEQSVVIFSYSYLVGAFFVELLGHHIVHFRQLIVGAMLCRMQSVSGSILGLRERLNLQELIKNELRNVVRIEVVLLALCKCCSSGIEVIKCVLSSLAIAL